MIMPRHWPYHSVIQIPDQQKLQQVLVWCYSQWGDSQYQHWCADYSAPDLKVMFCDHSYKIMFDLTWCATQNKDLQ
jgi:hypothetical protein